jgi:hypothetical protein
LRSIHSNAALASVSWDATRRVRAKTLNANPGLYTRYQLAAVPGTLWNVQPTGVDVPVDFPIDDRTGNDDTHSGDESTNPYAVSAEPDLSHGTGEITSDDPTNMFIRDSTGADGDTFEWRLQFGEFARVAIGDKWYRCSDFLNWKAHLKFKRVGGFWDDDGSIVAQDNAGF